MKKLMALILATILCLSVAACGGAPASGSSAAPTPSSDTASASADEPASESAPADPTADYPLTYKAPFTIEDVPTEGGGGKEGIKLGYGGVIFDSTKPVTLEYPTISLELLSAYKGEKNEWPVYNDEWKGWGYDSIENTDTASIRVMTLGRFDKRHAEVLREYDTNLSKLGVKQSEFVWPEDPTMTNVGYSKLESEASMTPVQLAEAAYYALFLQTWALVPAESQGVLITTPDGSYTAQQIVDLVAKG